MPQQLMKPRASAYRRARASVYAFEFDAAGFKTDLSNMLNDLKDGSTGATLRLGSARATFTLGVPIELGTPVAHDYGDSSRVQFGFRGAGVEIVVAPPDTTRNPPSTYSYPGQPPLGPSYKTP